MAILQRPDFSFQGQVPTNAIVQAYQQKALAEEKSRQEAEAAKEQKWIDTAKIVQTGADMVNKFTQDAKVKAQEDAFKSAVSLLGKKNEMPEEEFNPLIESYLAKAAPEDYKKEKIKSMMDLAKPEQMSVGMAPVPTAIELPDGSQALGYFDKKAKKYYLQDGSEAPSNSKRSYKYDIRQDSEGNYMVVSGASGRQVSGISSDAGTVTPQEVGTAKQLGQLPIKVRAEFQSDLSESKKDPVFREEYKKTLQATRMHDMLDAKNFAFDQKIGLQMARTLGDAGNISIVEQSEGKENKQLVQKAAQILETYIKSGKLTERNRTAIIEAVKVMDRAATKNIGSIVQMEEERLTSLYPQVDKRFIRESLVGKTLDQRIQKLQEEETLKQTGPRKSPKGYSYTVE